MSDDWSLKNKRKWIFPSMSYGDPELEIDDDNENDWENTWIASEDIETLRKKLIEDFTLRFGWHEHIVYIINKRFGVKK